MIPFKQYIAESFDNPYSFSFGPPPKTSNQAYRPGLQGKFKTSSGQVIKFTMAQSDEEIPDWEVSFGNEIKLPRGSIENTGTNYSVTDDGDAFRIMATIMAMIKAGIKILQNAPGMMIRAVFFTASKTDFINTGTFGKDVDTGRTKLYNRMVRKFANQIGKARISGGHNEVEYYIDDLKRQ